MENNNIGFWLVLWMVFVAEIPCIIRTMAMQVKNESVWAVVWGTMAGNVLALVVGVTLAKLAMGVLGPKAMEYFENVTALALIVLGFYLLLRHNHAH
jgi:putative Ca2+/H+ antiporter (TMEM165/GDT1 family)